MNRGRTRKTQRGPQRKTCLADLTMNHRIGRLVFGFAVGLLAAIYAYNWVASSGPNAQRAQEEQAVTEARGQLQSLLDMEGLTIVDPLLPNRVVGKAYVYASAGGWEVSGYYRRDDNDLWHPYLVTLDEDFAVTHLKISDSALRHLDGQGVLEVLP